jgi:hypothetical protein
MTETTAPSETAQPTATVKYVEFAQVLSAAAIGVMILPFLTNSPGYLWWGWMILICVAVAGALLPFSLARVVDVEHAAEEAEEDRAYYVVNLQRVATLEVMNVPRDIVGAVSDMAPFGGTGEEFRAKLFASVGETRGREQIDRLYKYLRGTPPPTGPDRITLR